MREIVRTNDAVLVSAIQALLDGAEIPHVVLDQNMSVLEGSIGILPRRCWSLKTMSMPRANCSRRLVSDMSFVLARMVNRDAL